MPQKPTETVTLRVSDKYRTTMEDGELIQLAGLVALLLAMAMFVLYGNRPEVFLMVVLGIIAIVAPETIDEVHSLIRGRR